MFSEFRQRFAAALSRHPQQQCRRLLQAARINEDQFDAANAVDFEARGASGCDDHAPGLVFCPLVYRPSSCEVRLQIRGGSS